MAYTIYCISRGEFSSGRFWRTWGVLIGRKGHGYLFGEALQGAVVASYAAGDPHGGHQNDGWPTTNEVLECITEAGLTVSDFIELGERPEHFDPRYRQNGWHMLLRQVRNDPAIDLFGDVLGTPLPATTGPSLFRRT